MKFIALLPVHLNALKIQLSFIIKEMLSSIKDFTNWVQPVDDTTIDALPFCNDKMSDYFLTEFKDTNFNIESFIS